MLFNVVVCGVCGVCSDRVNGCRAPEKHGADKTLHVECLSLDIGGTSLEE